MRNLSEMVRLIFFLVIVSGIGAGFAADNQTSKTSILVLVGDDMGPYLGCYGDPYVKTPNMDSIAEQGVRFDNAWVVQASCSPSRSAILTGLYPHQNGQIGLAHRGFSMSKDFPTIPSLLNKAGYFTGKVGKLHVRPHSALPFSYLNEYTDFERFDTQAYAPRVADFLKKAGDKPFYLNVSFADPHRAFRRQIKGLPENPVSAEDVKPLPFLEGLENVPGILEDVAGYYNGIMRVDAGVGLVLDELDKAGRLDDTIVILIGDHGAPFGRGKVTCYNPSLRIPFLVKWPGVSKPGTVSKSLVSTIDLLPTFLDIAGAEVPDNLPGRSIRPAVADVSQEIRDYMFGEFTAHLMEDYFPRRTVRNKRFQLIENLLSPAPNPTQGIEGELERKAAMDPSSDMTTQARAAIQAYVNPPRIELFDLEKDPDNFHNLAGDPAYDDVQKELQAALDNWRRQTDDPLLKPGEVERLGTEIRETRAEQLRREREKKQAQPKKDNRE